MDGNSPDIDTSTSYWASQLVTVRKNDATHDIPLDHVVLTFRFDTAVSLSSIELDVFLCPEWNIGAPLVTLYGSNNTNVFFGSFSKSDFLVNTCPHSLPVIYYPLSLFLFKMQSMIHSTTHGIIIVVFFAEQRGQIFGCTCRL